MIPDPVAKVALIIEVRSKDARMTLIGNALAAFRNDTLKFFFW